MVVAIFTHHLPSSQGLKNLQVFYKPNEPNYLRGLQHLVQLVQHLSLRSNTELALQTFVSQSARSPLGVTKAL
jgi:hypothetical protein